MLGRHRGDTPLAAGNLGGLITDIDPATVQLVLGRTRYNEPQEFEAELLGSLLQERLTHPRTRRGHPGSRPHSPHTAALTE